MQYCTHDCLVKNVVVKSCCQVTRSTLSPGLNTKYLENTGYAWWYFLIAKYVIYLWRRLSFKWIQGTSSLEYQYVKVVTTFWTAVKPPFFSFRLECTCNLVISIQEAVHFIIAVWILLGCQVDFDCYTARICYKGRLFQRQ